MYSIARCTVLLGVQYCWVYSIVRCTVLLGVQYCEVYSIVRCTVLSGVQYCGLYSIVRCTVLWSVQYCEVYNTIRLCIEGLPIIYIFIQPAHKWLNEFPHNVQDVVVNCFQLTYLTHLFTTHSRRVPAVATPT